MHFDQGLQRGEEDLLWTVQQFSVDGEWDRSRNKLIYEQVVRVDMTA